MLSALKRGQSYIPYSVLVRIKWRLRYRCLVNGDYWAFHFLRGMPGPREPGFRPLEGSRQVPVNWAEGGETRRET